MGRNLRFPVFVPAMWVLLTLATGVKAELTVPDGEPTNTTDDPCANADCQQGNCIPITSDTIADLYYPYECECNPGWMTFASMFPLFGLPLPCNIPNCSLNLDCSDAPSPPSPPFGPATPTNSTCIADGMCGHGECKDLNNDTLMPSIQCVCHPGYANVLNLPGGYCANECEIEGDCEDRGVRLPSLLSPSPAPTAGALGTAADQSASPPSDAGIASPGMPKSGRGTPIASPSTTPGLWPLLGPSQPSSPGCRCAYPDGDAFFATAAMVLGLFFASAY